VNYIFHFREVLYVLKLWKMDMGTKCSDTEYNATPWEWRTQTQQIGGVLAWNPLVWLAED